MSLDFSLQRDSEDLVRAERQGFDRGYELGWGNGLEHGRTQGRNVGFELGFAAGAAQATALLLPQFAKPAQALQLAVRQIPLEPSVSAAELEQVRARIKVLEARTRTRLNVVRQPNESF
jgi:hypothetical protein